MFRTSVFSKLLLNKVGNASDASQIPWRPACRRQLSGAGYTRQLDSSLTLYRKNRDGRRPLVVLIGWLFAKPRHLHKFGDLYMKNGFDVLTIQIYLHQLLVPRKVQSMAANALDLLSQNADDSSPIVIHAFSVGGYIYGEMLNLILRYPDRYGAAAERLGGIIFDSPVDYNHIPTGVSKSMTNNSFLRNSVNMSMGLFLKLSPSKRKHHTAAAKAFKENPLEIPAKFIYSLNDPVCEPDKMEEIASSWRQKGLVAETQFWASAHHVSTFAKYPDEYKRCVLDFLYKTGILNRKYRRQKGTSENN